MLPVLSVAQINNTLCISNEVTPPGGIAQVKVVLTSPQPISTGRFGFFGELDLQGIATSSNAGDVTGVAIKSLTGGTSVQFTSPSASLGRSDDYPILSLAFRVPQGAPRGTVFPVGLDQVSLSDALGVPIGLEIELGSVTVGGSLSITDVIPGGGVILPGQPIRVLGLGFLPKTRLRIKEQPRIPTFLLNNNEINLALPTQFLLDGARIDAANPDGSSVSYISYLRTTPMLQMMKHHEILDRTDPIFSSKLIAKAAVEARSGSFTALAMQNAGSSPVHVNLYGDGAADSIGSLTLPARYRIVYELPSNGPWHVIASAPIQMLGLEDDGKGSLIPFLLQPM